MRLTLVGEPTAFDFRKEERESGIARPVERFGYRNHDTMKDGPELCIDQKLSSTIRHKIIFFYTIPLRHRGTAWLPDLTKTSAKLGRIRG